MPIAAEISFNKDQWERALGVLKGKFDQFSGVAPLSAQLGTIFSVAVFQDIMNHFKTESGPSGAWREWSTAYRQHMDKVGKGGNKILQDSGKLRNSFTPSNSSGTAGFRLQNGGIVFYNAAQTASGFPYAAAHDEGGPKLPQRKFMWLSKGALDSVAIQIVRWLSDTNME